MNIVLFCEHGEKFEIGTGHLYRLMSIEKNLCARGHNVLWHNSNIGWENVDILVIDHMYSQSSLILNAKSYGVNVLLIDGAESDVDKADVSISAVLNKKATHKGHEYFAIPSPPNTLYNIETNSKTVFVSMGGFDANNIAYSIMRILEDMGVRAIVSRSINHSNFKMMFKNVEVYDGSDYYDAMHECIIGITNGGLTMVQSLCYGLPTIAIPQYDHQSINIDMFDNACISGSVKDLRKDVSSLMSSQYTRECMSRASTGCVDGLGVMRVCNIIETMI